jgi:hypothetical protein
MKNNHNHKGHYKIQYSKIVNSHLTINSINTITGYNWTLARHVID